MKTINGVLLFLIYTTIGCGGVDDHLSKVSAIKIQLPTAQEFKKLSTKNLQKRAKNSSLYSIASSSASTLDTTIEYNNLCFVINVTGSKIINTVLEDLSCNISRGIFKGSVPAGGELSLELQSDQIADFEIYAYLRSNTGEICPNITDSEWHWPLDRVYKLGNTKQVKITAPQTDVEININLPLAHQNIVIENSWSSSCLPAIVEKNPIVPTHRTSLGSKSLVGSYYKLNGRLASKQETKTLTGSEFKISNWRPR